MQIEIKKEQAMPLLSRKRITAFVEFDGKTPARLELRNKAAEMLKVEPKFVIIRHIYQRYGARHAKLIIHVYENEDMLNRLEEKRVIEKNVHGKSKKVNDGKAEEKEEKNVKSE